MDYRPRPIDTGSTPLGADLLALTERLAENTHDVWAAGRIEEGWRFGPARDDAAKLHPCLVPYADLPDSEREYDRRTALETLRAIVKLGYRIEPPTSQPTPPAADATVPGLMQVLADRGTNRATLLALWRTPKEQRESWARSAEVFARFAERMLGAGEPLLAYDLIAEGLAGFPADRRLRQLQGMALARSGDTARAATVLGQLRDEGHQDEETLGLLARTQKDLGLKLLDLDPAAAREQLGRAQALYADAYAQTNGYWTGINAAALALVLGEEADATQLAGRVRDQARAALRDAEAKGSDTYWEAATLGEAALIAGDPVEAERWYARASGDGWAHRRFGDVGSTRRQARLLARFRPGTSGLVERCFRSPRIAIFTGHRIDHPRRANPRFPAALEPAVRAAIRTRLERSGVSIGYASAASGADLLFLETLLELGGEAHVVLPYDRVQFLRSSVEVEPGDGWAERFARVLDQADVVVASPQRLEVGGVSYDFANEIMHGLARLRADQFDGELVPIAVWDGRVGDGPGGTASVVARWRDQGLEPEIIDLADLASRHPGGLAARPPQAPPPQPARTLASPADLASRVVAILFGDVVGFSKLVEEQTPRFVHHFLGLVADRLAKLGHPPIKKNTWGDGLFVAFDDLEAAGRFALDLRDQVVTTDWAAVGLPAGLNMRIALHAGPVHECVDPVTEHPNCIGTHVSHAARIEPITPPGQVFASQSFAALAAARQVQSFRCHYVGQTPLAKGYGVYPTYHVHSVAGHG